MANSKSEKTANLPKLNDFETWERKLVASYKKSAAKTQNAEAKIRPRKRSTNVLKLEVYRYYDELIKAALIDKLREYVKQRDGNKWKGRGDEPEQWITRLVSSTEQTNNRVQWRSRLAAEMRLASVNKVRPDVLLGFLHEAGHIDLIKRAAASKKTFSWASAYQ